MNTAHIREDTLTASNPSGRTQMLPNRYLKWGFGIDFDPENWYNSK